MEDAGESDIRDEISIEETFTGTSDDCEITLIYNSTRFIVLLKQPNSAESDTIEGKLLRELDDAAAMSDEMIFDRFLEKIYDIVVSECKMTMHKLAPGKLELLEHYNSASSKYPHSPVQFDPVLVLSTDTPMVRAAAIRAIKDLRARKVVEVEWVHETYAFKTAFTGGEAQLQREIHILQVLKRELGHSYPRIPRLQGLVVSNGKIIGFLEDLIPVLYAGSNGHSLCASGI
ncbi:hypothetical protein MMC17_005542 [Xylographa soralifera]|nr:hypothetical protein [Xylographa soralifera]